MNNVELCVVSSPVDIVKHASRIIIKIEAESGIECADF